MQCEFCGMPVEETYPVIFEGKKIFACDKCIKEHKLVRIMKIGAKPATTAKQIINRRGVQRSISKRRTRGPIDMEDEYILKEDYGNIIKSAREAMGLTQKDLAFKLKTKLSVIRRLETGRLVPSPDLGKKLEKALNILLYERISAEVDEHLTDEAEVPIRLGDILGGSEE